MPTLALLDGHSLAYRAFFALPEDLATKSGQVTNSVYGFTSMLIKMLAEHHPDQVVVAWDSGRATFRTEEFADYKAQREAAPDAFKNQLPLIREVLEALGIAQIEMPGYEADDLIASLARRAEGEGWDVLVVTGDRDSFQLIDDHTKVLYTRRGITDVVLATAEWVEERYGIPPEKYPDYAALRGDPSDNLPGVPGIGEKTAARLIDSYRSLEGIYEHLDDMTPKLRENLVAHRDQVFLNRELMRLVSDLPLDVRLGTEEAVNADRSRVKDLFETLEFHSLWDRLAELDREQHVGERIDVTVRSATSSDAIASLSRVRPLPIRDVWDAAHLAGLMIAVSDEEALFVPSERIGLLEALLTDTGHPKVTHDAKGLIKGLGRLEIVPEAITCDVALAAYLINPGSRSYGLAEVASHYLGVELEPTEGELDGEPSQGSLDFRGGPDLSRAGREAIAVGRLAPLLLRELEDRDELTLFRELEMPLTAVLARMEEAGIRVDRAYLEELGDSLRDQIATLQDEIYEEAGGPFNINSTLQLREVLYERLGLPILKKTSKGAPSTDASVLAKLADAHPVVEHLLRYRELEKLRSTYVDGYLPLIGPDGRIHASFNQMGSTTGRLSSEQPNLQNIPIRSEAGMRIRRAFVPEEGWWFIVADYSQIELRVLAHMSGDPALLDAFRGQDADIHTATAAKVFDVAPENVTSQMRRMAKVINFGLIYGMEAYGLADRLEISREEAAEYIEAYFARFPKVQEFRQHVVEEARARGYTTTAFGRRRYLPELKSDNYRIRQMGERMALNAPVQGTAADIIKKAMIDLDTELLRAGSSTMLLLQVHDELVLEAPPDEFDASQHLITKVMEQAADLRVPLRIDLSTGRNLAECKL
jgi:DNA polymerase-1